MSGPELITFGCRLNAAESEAMRALAAGADDLVIVNSCAVTAEAVRQARQAIHRVKRARPDARVIVTGCAAQIDPARFAAMPEVSRVIGNSEKFAAESFAGEKPSPLRGERVHVADIMTIRTAPDMAVQSSRTRAFVAVQTGCDHRCTFCVIPYGRGNSRSLPAGAVIAQIRALADEGIAEIVLTGVDVTSYGSDLPGRPTLGMLVDRILRLVPALPRLRLSSLDSVEIDARLFDLVAHHPRIMPHLHLSLQAGDDLILKRMKRRHSRAQAVELVARLRAARPGIAIGADLIAGFPTESETMFENSLQLIADCAIAMAHVFPYSPRPGTPAARMPQVAPPVVKARAARLRAAGRAQQQHWLGGLVGSVQQVLVEADGSGHAENFATVRLSDAAARGAIVTTRITGVDGDRLIGRPL